MRPRLKKLKPFQGVPAAAVVRHPDAQVGVVGDLRRVPAGAL
jgi:hypothetical protein